MLHSSGVRGFKSLTMMPSSDRAVTFESIARYKRKARASVAGAKYTIVANIGDQWSDMGSATQLSALGGVEKNPRIAGIFFFKDHASIKLPNQ